MRLAMGTREVLDAEGLVRTYLSPGRRGLRYAYPYYDGLVTNSDPAALCTGDLLAPTLLGVHVDLDRMHTLTALLPLLQRGLDALPPFDLVEADDETCDQIAALYDPLDDPSALDRDVRGSLLAKGHARTSGASVIAGYWAAGARWTRRCAGSPRRTRTVRTW